MLDLGRVEIAAVVSLNGKVLETLWKAPFTLDVTDELRDGNNHLDILVANTWTNRLIGDERIPRNDGYTPTGRMVDWYSANEPMPESARYTFTSHNFYDRDRDLMPSGLLGPVRLMARGRVVLEPSP